MSAMKTLLVEWTEITQHRAKVQVPVDTDPEGLDLANRLAELTDDGFQGLQREIDSVRTVDHDPAAEILIHADPAARRARTLI